MSKITNAVWKSFFLSILLSGFLLIFSSCSGGGGGGGTSSENDNTEIATLTPIITIADATAFRSTSLTMSEYSTVTLLSSNHMDTDGNSQVVFVDADKGQSVFISDANDTPIAVAYFSSEQIALGQVDITSTSLADGIIMSNPLLLGFSASDREAILDQVKIEIGYQAFVTEIESVLATTPDKLLDEDVNPQIFEFAIDMILNSIELLDVNTAQEVFDAVFMQTSMAAIVKAGADELTPILGDINGPYLSDIPGDNVLAVNPTMVFYGIEINGLYAQLISGKEAAFALFDKNAAKAVQEEIDVRNGNNQFTFVKNVIQSPAGLRSAAANGLKVASFWLDFWAYCPISNRTIKSIIERDDSFLELAKLFGDDIGISLPNQVLTKVADTLANDTKLLGLATRALYNNANNVDGAAKFFKNSKMVFKAAEKFLIGYVATQKYLPFAWDFVTSPTYLTWCLTQEDGILNSIPTCSFIPPVARFSYSPSNNIYENDTVMFTASDSDDPNYDVSSLMFKWDFDGDGVADTNWDSTPIASSNYSVAGIYSVVLFVRNPDGLESVTEKIISINKDPSNLALPISYSQITSNNINSILSNDGVSGTLNGKYIFKLVVEAGGGYYTHTEMKIHFNVIPLDGFAKGISDDSAIERAQLGTDPNYTFNNGALLGINGIGWVDVTSYVDGNDIYMFLDSKWGTNTDTYIYLWFSSNSPMTTANYTLLDKNTDDFGSINITGYEIIDR